jgi:hypothetical protein
MTKIHHLNFGAMRAIPVDPNSITSCHCLLLEDSNGLVLIDSGLGLIEMEHPHERFGEQLLNIWGFAIDENLTAVRQLEKLGFNPADVKPNGRSTGPRTSVGSALKRAISAWGSPRKL